RHLSASQNICVEDDGRYVDMRLSHRTCATRIDRSSDERLRFVSSYSEVRWLNPVGSWRDSNENYKPKLPHSNANCQVFRLPSVPLNSAPASARRPDRGRSHAERRAALALAPGSV